MLLKLILLFAIGATAQSAWRIPDNQANGVYGVSTDENGAAHAVEHKFIASLTEPPANIPRELVASAKFYPKRDNIGVNSVTCRTYSLNPTDTDMAVANLRQQCGNGGFVKKNWDYYAIKGSVVAWYCNSNSWDNQCFDSEAADAFARITAQCGQYTAGWDFVPSRAGGYGYEAQGTNFCGRGTNG